MSQGVIYIATGKQHTQEALTSARILKEVSELPVTLLSDRTVDDPVLDGSIKLTDPRGGTSDQMYAMEQSPYDETICLDSDIYVAGDITELFRLLETFDLAAAHAPHRREQETEEGGEPPQCFPEYNSGVVVYRLNSAVKAFLETWREEYERDMANDVFRNQPSFRRALFKSDLKLATLPPEYNCRIQFPGQASLPVKIFHGRLQSVENTGTGMAQVMDIRKVAKRINSKSGPRIFYPKGKSVKVKSQSEFYSYRLVYSIKRRGVVGTLKKILAR